MIKEGDTVLVAVSGGKDSIALLAVLNELRSKIHFNLVATYVDLGIEEISSTARFIVENVCRSLGINLVVPSIKEVVRASVPELAKYSRRAVCSVCGIVKRYVINSVAIALGASSVATGHNMDDLMANIIKEFLNLNFSRLSKLVPRTEGIKNLVVGRVRPLYEVTERENLVYALLKKLPFLKITCPYVNLDGIEFHIKKFLTELDIKYPGLRVSFLRRFSKVELPEGNGEVRKCRYCGLISRGDVCSFCRLTIKSIGRALGPEVRAYVGDLVRSIK